MQQKAAALKRLASFAALGASVWLAACDPPPVAVEADAPPPAVDIRIPQEAIPAAVLDLRTQLLAIAETGNPWDMSRIADQTPGFVSNAGGMRHRDYWYLKLRAGDWPMAHLGRVFDFPPARDDTPDGPVYVWPYMARLAPDAIGVEAARDIDALAGDGMADAMRDGAPWPGYSLGVRADGLWLYFFSGAEMEAG